MIVPSPELAREPLGEMVSPPQLDVPSCGSGNLPEKKQKIETGKSKRGAENKDTAKANGHRWTQWEEIPNSPALVYFCNTSEPLGLNTDGGTNGTVFVESTRPKTWAAKMKVETPCKILTINGTDVQSLPTSKFDIMMKARPVTLTCKGLQLVKDRDALNKRCKSAVENLRAPPSLSEAFGFINALLGEHQLTLNDAELRPATDVGGLKRRAQVSPGTPRSGAASATPVAALKRRPPISPATPKPSSINGGKRRPPATPPSTPLAVTPLVSPRRPLKETSIKALAALQKAAVRCRPVPWPWSSPRKSKRSLEKASAEKQKKPSAFLTKWLSLRPSMQVPGAVKKDKAIQGEFSSSSSERPAKRQRTSTSRARVSDAQLINSSSSDECDLRVVPHVKPTNVKADEELAQAIGSSLELAVASAKALESAAASAVATEQQLSKVEALVRDAPGSTTRSSLQTEEVVSISPRVTLPPGALAAAEEVDDITPKAMALLTPQPDSPDSQSAEARSDDLTPKVERPRSWLGMGRHPKGIAEFIHSRRPKVIVLMGAGASTSAGIPDFRTPGTGLYDVLERQGLKNPRLAFDLDHFRKDPDHLYAVAREIWPRPERTPTLVHKFVKLLHDEGLLLRCYTQNIDGLERQVGIPDEMLVEAHGNFRSAQGVDTGRSVPAEEVREAVFNKGGAEELRSKYGELVKPGIMLYGDKLPKRFGKSVLVDFPKCELLIVIGTSLRVAPFCQLIRQVPTTCPRLLMNQKAVGLAQDIPGGFSFGEGSSRDVSMLGSCDDGAQQLCSHLGWTDRLC